jgi:hypothetical protein
VLPPKSGNTYFILTWRADYDHQFTKNYGLYVALSGRFLSAVNVTEYTSTSLDEMTYSQLARDVGNNADGGTVLRSGQNAIVSSAKTLHSGYRMLN